MIVGIGTDLVVIERFKRMLHDRPALAVRLLTDGERALSIESQAARFSAKEALAKALGTGIRRAMGFQAASILSDELGKPCVHTHGELTKMFASQGLRAHISLSDDKGFVIAYCLVEQIG